MASKLCLDGVRNCTPSCSSSCSSSPTDVPKRSESATEVRRALRHQRYRRTAAAAAASCTRTSDGARRRIPHKDRPHTLEMLTSDDDVNEYEATRPSSYLEPTARRNRHETTAPHLKSSFETLYNPDLTRPRDESVLADALSSSCDSMDSNGDTAAVTELTKIAPEKWHLMCSPKAPSPYVDAAKQRRISSDSKGQARRSPSGEIDKTRDPVDRFNGNDVQKRRTAAVESTGSSGQPMNLSIQVSRHSEASSLSSSNGTIGVDVKINLGKLMTVPESSAAAVRNVDMRQSSVDEESAAVPNEWAKLPAKFLSNRATLSPSQEADLRKRLSGNESTHQTPSAALKPRGRRVLPAVPDSADLEVTDLLRETLPTGAADRPKSAVEILVSKERSSSVLQAQKHGTESGSHNRPSAVSQQLRSLFHNPSPQIMLHRAATRPTPPPPPGRTGSSEFQQHQQANRYHPLRGSHSRAEDTSRSSNSASQLVSRDWYVDGPARKSLGPDELPPEQPLRRSATLLPNQRASQDPLSQPPRPKSTMTNVPPPVPPRLAKTRVARQQSPSRFYTRKVQLKSSSSDERPVVSPRHRQLNGEMKVKEVTGGQPRSVDQQYRRIVLTHDQSINRIAKGDAPDDYRPAEHAGGVAGVQFMVQQQHAPTRIQTNPRTSGRYRDSVTGGDDIGGRGIAAGLDGPGNLASLGMTFASSSASRAPIGSAKSLDTAGSDDRRDQPKRRQVVQAVHELPSQRTQPSTEAAAIQQSRHEVRVDGQSASTARDRLFAINQQAGRGSHSAGSAVQNRPEHQPRPEHGRSARVPRNAVRVLPPSNDAELLRAVRNLGGGRGTSRSPRQAGEDALADLEQLCRKIQLDDAGLLDGADRHETLVRSTLGGRVAFPARQAKSRQARTAGHAIQQQQQQQQRGIDSTYRLQAGEEEEGQEIVL